MSELGASSGGRRFMGMMPLPRRKHQEELAIVCQNGAAGAVGLERRLKLRQVIKRNQRPKTRRSRFTHSKILRKESKV